MSAIDAAIQGRLAACRNVLAVSHLRPDGDAVGSLLALGLALQNSGKQVQMVLSDGLPEKFRHLPGSEQVRTQAEGTFDLHILLDCSDLQRCGEAFGGRTPDLVIDHHATNDLPAALRLVDTGAAATACILTRSMPHWGLKITAPIAACLLTGILSDTIGFRTPNTTAEVLHQAASLVEAGANLGSLYYEALVRRTFNGTRYWGAGLSSLQRQDGILWACLRLADRQAAGYPGNDDDDLISVLSAVEGADVAVLFVEQTPTRTKVSWRALRPGVDVARIAKQFGGGGHQAAAGAELDGSLEHVCEVVLAATRSA